MIDARLKNNDRNKYEWDGSVLISIKTSEQIQLVHWTKRHGKIQTEINRYMQKWKLYFSIILFTTKTRSEKYTKLTNTKNSCYRREVQKTFELKRSSSDGEPFVTI